MVSILEAIFLAVIQGITEWLPISSSGHLALAQYYFHIQASVLFDIILHLGTLLAVVVYFRQKILDIIQSALRLDFKSENGSIIPFAILALIPTAIIGFAFKDFFESMFQKPALIGAGLVLTGLVLYSTKYLGKKANSPVGLKQALAMGIAQGIAVAPGISRSGSTISAGIAAQGQREKVAAFSFLIAVPAVIGAAIFELKGKAIEAIGIEAIAIGLLVSFAVGYASIHVLFKLLKGDKFHWFAYYCWLAGLTAIAASFLVK
ncbi:Undecaprenyl-diphosphatase [Candidatus Gugararchaeum adminiculabundum]|nr:Undecaprenyl-diphosphatase [Candidatus Gugararchaeum adminiculabundum]